MNLLKTLFSKQPAATGNKGFWQWFEKHATAFFEVLKVDDSNLINKNFIEKVMPKLEH